MLLCLKVGLKKEQRKQGPLMEHPDGPYDRGEIDIYDFMRNEKIYIEQLEYLHGDYDSEGNYKKHTLYLVKQIKRK